MDDNDIPPVHIPITDELDLHTFRPSEVPDLLDDYFKECIDRGILSVRIVHGKGTGALKKRVRAILDRHRNVKFYTDAPPRSGGWGATCVELVPEPDQ